ncbi:Hypothetical predicted protein [Lynx pardinus]|uniref:Uncharacterized protein n=1 Tax=Lynx pardinus TaxID=191816 RepID=A0A485P827_LYNPA|nr:Hypothetical predicted protein [Lynx pardinus]
MLQSASQSFLVSAQRGGRPCLLKRRENLETWQRWTRGNKKEFAGFQCTQGSLLRPFSCFVLSIAPKSKKNIPAYPLVMLQRNWERRGIILPQMTSSPTKRRLLN